jgi:hypothetical protein
VEHLVRDGRELAAHRVADRHLHDAELAELLSTRWRGVARPRDQLEGLPQPGG